MAQERDLFSLSSSSDDDDEEIVEYLEYLNRPRKERIVRYRPQHLDMWDDQEFFIRFRLKKQTVLMLLTEIEVLLENPTDRNNAVPPIQQLLMTLRYYALGTMLISVGDFAGVHKSTACKIIHRVTDAIARLSREHIKFPHTQEDIAQVRRRFFEIARFPRVCGALDCTHVKIQSPGGDNAEYFRNRKGYFSLNVQTICDADLKILDIVASWPGSTHDTTIFNSSAIRARFEAGDMADSLLVADSGYDCRSYLIPPLIEPTTRAEELFNESQKRTRNPVERKYGVWKRRFPILSVGMRVSLDHVMGIIMATAVLHNLACGEKEEVPPPDPDLQFIINLEEDNIPQPIIQNPQRGRAGNDQVRQALILDYFARL